VRLIRLRVLGTRGDLVVWMSRLAVGWVFGCVRLVMSRWFLGSVGFCFLLLRMAVLDDGIQRLVAKTACSRATCSISRACRHKDVE
jgi:hypothetical protein